MIKSQKGENEIIKSAKMASKVWNSFETDKQNKIKKYFHLRPTKSGVTIVSTIPFFPMRGITNLKSEYGLKNKLDEIYNSFKKIVSADISEATKILKESGFLKRKENKKNDLEEDIQAIMIRNMSSDKNLAEKLNKNKIKFIASELIFEQGKHRVDIVGYDDDDLDLYLFELKKGRTTKVEQVRKYVEYYSKPDNRRILEKLLKNYPISPIESFKSIKGVMIMQYAENSYDSKKWEKLAKKNEIDILFFEPSLSYK